MIIMIDPDAELSHFLVLFIHSLLFFLTSYILMTLSDLESDYINSRECCDKLNFWTKPRLGGLFLLCILPSSGPSWIFTVFSIPFASWYLAKVRTVPQGNSGLYEPTEIRLRPLLRQSIKETIVFEVFHSVAFFCLLFTLVSRLAYGTEEVPW